MMDTLFEMFSLNPDRTTTAQLKEAAMSEIKAFPSPLQDYRQASDHHKNTIFFFSPVTLAQAHYKVGLYAAVAARLTGNKNLYSLAQKAVRAGNKSSSWKADPKTISQVIRAGGTSIGRAVWFSPSQRSKLKFVEGVFGSWGASDIEAGQAIARQQQIGSGIAQSQRELFQSATSKKEELEGQAQWIMIKHYFLYPAATMVALYGGWRAYKGWKKDG